MKQYFYTLLGLCLLFVSQLLMSFGYEFLMSQNPIDYAHWALLLSALLLIDLWRSLPRSITKGFGLTIMTLGIAGIIGMCMIDFILWAANDQPELKQNIFDLISNHKVIELPFLMIGPTMFYMGIGIATYGLFKQKIVIVLSINLGLLLIGLGHIVFGNHLLPALGALIVFISMTLLLLQRKKETS